MPPRGHPRNAEVMEEFLAHAREALHREEKLQSHFATRAEEAAAGTRGMVR